MSNNPAEPTRFDRSFDEQVARRERARQSFIEQRDDVSESDIEELRRTDDGQFEPVFTEDFLRDRAVEQIVSDRESVSRDDIAGVERTEEGFQPTFTQEFRRQQAREQIAAENEEVDIDDIASVQETEDGFEAEFTEGFRRQQARETIAEENANIDQEDVESVEVTEDGYEPEFTESFLAERAREQVAQDVEGYDPNDFEVDLQEDEVRLDEEARQKRRQEINEALRDRAAELGNVPKLLPGDFEVVREDGTVTGVEPTSQINQLEMELGREIDEDAITFDVDRDDGSLRLDPANEEAAQEQQAEMREELREDAAERAGIENIKASDFEVVERESGLFVEPTSSVEQLEMELGRDIDEEAITFRAGESVEGGGFVAAPTNPEELEEQRIQETRAQQAEAFDEQLPVDVAAEDVQIQETDDGVRASLADPVAEQAAVEQIDEEIGSADIDEDDVVIEDGQARLSQDTARRVGAQNLDPSVPIDVDAADVQVGDDGTVELRETAVEELQEVTAAQQALGAVPRAVEIAQQSEAVTAAGAVPDETMAAVGPQVQDPTAAVEITDEDIATFEEVADAGVPIEQTGSTTRAPGTIEGRRKEPITDQLAGVEERLADTEIRVGRAEMTAGEAIGVPADATAEAFGTARSVVGGNLPLNKIQRQSNNASQAVQEDVASPIAANVGRSVEITAQSNPTTAGKVNTRDDGAPADGPQTPGGAQVAHFTESVLDIGVESSVGLPAGAIETGRLGADAAEASYDMVEEQGVVEGSEAILGTAGAVGTALAASAAQSATEDPVGFAGSVTGGVATGVIAGKGLGTAGRAAKARLRTAGGTKIDIEDVTQDEVVEGDRAFPAAKDRGLYERDPAEAVRRQADEKTPDEVAEQFDEAGVDDGVVLKKGLELDPDGPGAAGFKTQTGDYENPGAFVGPELSKYFLGLESSASPTYSLRPGLPSLGGKPTSVFIKTDVENPRRSKDLDELDDELIEREGDTTAVTKPASEVNEGEIEAIIPPGSEFADVKGGPLRNTLRRFGIGSDFYTEVDGRRVPIRTVAPADELDRSGSAGLADLFDDERAQAGGSPPSSVRTFELSDVRRGGGEAVDRPAPTGAAPSVESESVSGGVDSNPARLREATDRQNPSADARTSPSTWSSGMDWPVSESSLATAAGRSRFEGAASEVSSPDSTTGGSSETPPDIMSGGGLIPSERGSAPSPTSPDYLSSGAATPSMPSPVPTSSPGTSPSPGGSSNIPPSPGGSSGGSSPPETPDNWVSRAGITLDDDDDDGILPEAVGAVEERDVFELPDPTEDFLEGGDIL